MPHSTPDFSRRAELTELMDEPCSREEMRACLRDLARVNRWLLGYRPTLRWLDEMLPVLKDVGQPIRILDVGCGYGDALREVEKWALSQKLAVELTGLDLNPDATAIAAEASDPSSRICWISADVFAYKPDKLPHLVLSSLFTHHLPDRDVVRFVEWMEAQALVGWFINDLSRAATPYHLFRIFSTLFGFHRFVRHDGPVSIARSFVFDDWLRICKTAVLINGSVSIRPFTPGRLCVARSKGK